jgi:ribosomal protein S18 acetylase RimI-like enzyme
LLNQKKIIISNANSRDIEDISLIHCMSLPEDIISLLGTSFAKRYYMYQFNYKNSILLKVELNNEIVGFIAGAEGVFFLKRCILKNFLFLCFALVNLIIKKPKKTILVFEIILMLLLSKGYKFFKKDFELQYIAIKQGYQGKKLGSSLVNELKKMIDKKLFRNIIVKTLKSTTENIDFYKRNSFEHLLSNDKRVWLRFKLYNSIKSI